MIVSSASIQAVWRTTYIDATSTPSALPARRLRRRDDRADAAQLVESLGGRHA
jgi:hypothetical protein